jgi:hypothetical protein
VKFTPEEDCRLVELVRLYGANDWIAIAGLLGNRNPRQCRERYCNYLDPSLRCDPWTAEEDALIIAKHDMFGAKWSKIAKFFHNRSDNALRNRWQLIARHRIREANGGPPVRSHRDNFGPTPPPSACMARQTVFEPARPLTPDVLPIERKPDGPVSDPFEMAQSLKGWSLFGDDSADSWSGFRLF